MDYKVVKIQEGMPMMEVDDYGELVEKSVDWNFESRYTICTCNNLDYAKLIAEKERMAIAEGCDFAASGYTPIVKIYEVQGDLELLVKE